MLFHQERNSVRVEWQLSAEILHFYSFIKSLKICLTFLFGSKQLGNLGKSQYFLLSWTWIALQVFMYHIYNLDLTDLKNFERKIVYRILTSSGKFSFEEKIIQSSRKSDNKTILMTTV